MKIRLVLGLVLALTLAGCGEQSEVSGGDHTLLVHDPSLSPSGGDGALIEGPLTTRDGCILVEQEDADIAYPVIWPSGTSIASDGPLVLELPSGDELAVGQVVTGGGGYHDASSETLEVDVPTGCVPETGEVAVFNPGADLAIISR